MSLKGLNAIYLSPSLPRSRLAGRPLEDAVIAAIAATHLYEKVHFHAANQAEAERLAELIERFTPSLPVDIDIVALG